MLNKLQVLEEQRLLSSWLEKDILKQEKKIAVFLYNTKRHLQNTWCSPFILPIKKMWFWDSDVYVSDKNSDPA